MDDNPFPQRVWGRILDILDAKQLAWPGHGIHPNRGFQFIEKDYMKAEEYEAFIFDQTDFMLRNYWPTLRKVMLALIDEGLDPMVFWEGDCTSRLETIKDIPAGKAVYLFEKTECLKR